jgi:hypothetical protein
MRTKKFVFEMLVLLVIMSMALTSCAPAATEAPVATQAPATEMPATEAPATEMPATEMPATEMPATEAPAAEIDPELVAAAQAEGTLTTIALPVDWCNYRKMIDTFKTK